MRMKGLSFALAGLALSAALPAQAIEENFYNGVWYNENVGYVISKQNGDRLVGTLLMPNGGYLAFFGGLSTYGCTISPCPSRDTSTMAMLNQLFVEGQVTLKVDFGANTGTPPTTATITLTTCDTPNGCLIPVGVPLEIQKIF